MLGEWFRDMRTFLPTLCYGMICIIQDCSLKRLNSRILWNFAGWASNWFLYSNRALKIVLVVRRDWCHPRSLLSLHLPHRPLRTAWPWITVATCMQQGPSKAQWKQPGPQTAPPMLRTASVLKWVAVWASAGTRVVLGTNGLAHLSS